jgi:cyanate lyase
MLVGGKVIASGNFTVHAQDYGVEIPSLVKEKFAEQIKVAFNFSYDVK